MNFYAEQDSARRRSKWLVLLFIAAVTILISITSLLVAVGLWLIDGQLSDASAAAGLLLADSQKPISAFFNWSNFGRIGLWVSGTILCVITFKWLQLRAGGRAVAESLGGSRVNPNTEDTSERRALNVVEEMALAANMPVPALYLLKGEKGINAFAAGHGPADAVIGITQGALEQFDRDQLQGVVAHEFSHILNGDMRLNLRLIAMLAGIIFIANAGELLLRAGGGGYGSASRHSRGDVRIAMAGLVLLALGWLGSFFAGLIKAAINRQREFLADASAVQFTRNPQGIRDALRVIGGYEGGSQMFSARGPENSHLFISNALGQLTSFATHPPLRERLRRLDSQWDGTMIKRKMIIAEQAAAAYGNSSKQTKPEPRLKRSEQAAVAAAAAAAFIQQKNNDASTALEDSLPCDSDSARTAIDSIPETLLAQAHDPFGAIAVVFTLLLDDDDDIQKKQLSYIKDSGIKGLSIQCLQLLSECRALPARLRLPLLELSLPALKCMSAPQYKRVKRALLLIIRADRRLELFEWCLFQLVRHYLAADFEGEKPQRPRYKKAHQVAEHYQLVLSMLAHYGHQDIKEAERGFGRGANSVGLYTIDLLPREGCKIDDFGKAVNALAQCYPLLKPRLLKGLADCAKQDGKITIEEREIIASISAVIDCPGPELAG